MALKTNCARNLTLNLMIFVLYNFKTILFQMGYANFEQSGQGIHLRQFSRAFVLADDNSRLVFVSVDAAMMGNGIRKEVQLL